MYMMHDMHEDTCLIIRRQRFNQKHYNLSLVKGPALCFLLIVLFFSPSVNTCCVSTLHYTQKTRAGDMRSCADKALKPGSLG